MVGRQTAPLSCLPRPSTHWSTRTEGGAQRRCGGGGQRVRGGMLQKEWVLHAVRRVLRPSECMRAAVLASGPSLLGMLQPRLKSNTFAVLQLHTKNLSAQWCMVQH